MLIVRSAKGVLDGKRHFLSVTDMGLLHSACLTIRMRGSGYFNITGRKSTILCRI